MAGGMRVWAGMMAVLVLMTAPAMAAEAAGPRAVTQAGPLKPGPQSPGPLSPGLLKPGKSAGIHGAQQVRAGLALVSAGAIIAVVVVAAGSSGGNGGSQPDLQSAPVTTAP
jgi:hypothetical protein